MKYSCFKKAREEMFLADYSGTARIGCVVYYKGALLAKGFNTNKTCPVQKKFNIYRYKSSNTLDKVHAEISALKKIRFLDIDFSRVEVYIYRETKKGEIAMARPCESCMAFIKELGIKRIFYTTPDGYVEERLK